MTSQTLQHYASVAMKTWFSQAFFADAASESHRRGSPLQFPNLSAGKIHARDIRRLMTASGRKSVHISSNFSR
jgi:hypothetical protein